MLPKKTSTNLWSDDYHVYDLEWKSDRITLKVDEEQYGDQEVPPSLFNNPVSTLNCKYVTTFTFFPCLFHYLSLSVRLVILLTI